MIRQQDIFNTDFLNDKNKDITDYVAKNEGFRAIPYYDQGKNLTVGYGTNIQNKTPEQVQELYRTGLSKEMQDYTNEGANFIQQNTKVPLTRDQLKAMTDVYYNAGPGAAKKLVENFNAGGIKQASDYMINTATVKGQPNKGVLNRRKEDVALMNTPSYEQDAKILMQRNAELTGDVQTPESNAAMLRTMGNDPAQWQAPNGQIINPNVQQQNQVPMQPSPERKLPVVPQEHIAKHAEVVDKQKQEIQSNPALNLIGNNPAFKDAMSKWEESTRKTSELLSNGMLEKAQMESQAADKAYEAVKAQSDFSKKAYDDFHDDMDKIDDHVNRNRLIDNMPVANKLMMAVSLFAGAFNRNGQNAALDMVQGEIQKDLERQKLEYDRGTKRAQNVYLIADKFSKDQMERSKLAEAIMYQMAAARLDEAKAHALPAQTQAAIDQMKAQMMGFGSKDALDIMNKRMDLAKKGLEMSEIERKKGLDTGRTQIVDPMSGEPLGNVPDFNEAKEVRDLTAKTAASIEDIKSLRDLMQESSRAGNWLNPASKNAMSLKIAAIRATLSEAAQSSPSARLPVSEVNNLGERWQEIISGKNIAKYGPEFFISEIDGIINKIKHGYKMSVYARGLKAPSWAKEEEKLAPVR